MLVGRSAFLLLVAAPFDPVRTAYALLHKHTLTAGLLSTFQIAGVEIDLGTICPGDTVTSPDLRYRPSVTASTPSSC